MKFLLCVLSIIFVENVEVKASITADQFVTKVREKEKLSGPGVSGKYRPKTAYSAVVRSPDSAFNKGNLPQINTNSRSPSEYSIGTNSTSSLSSFSDKSVSPSIIPSPPTAIPSSRSGSFQSKILESRRFARQHPAMPSPEDQYKITQAYSCVSKISNPEIQHQARIKVGEASTPDDKEQLAIAWKEYLSKILNDEDRAAAAQEVQSTPTAFKLCVAEAWCGHLINIPAGPVREKAIADVRSAKLAEDKEMTAKVWAKYLVQIKDERVQARAASLVRRVTCALKESLAQEYLSLADTEFIRNTVASDPVVNKSSSWWSVLSAIKNIDLKNEARGYIEHELADQSQRVEMAHIWVQYLAKIEDESTRNAAFEATKSVAPNQWRDVASEHYLQYTLQRTALSNQEY